MITILDFRLTSLGAIKNALITQKLDTHIFSYNNTGQTKYDRRAWLKLLHFDTVEALTIDLQLMDSEIKKTTKHNF